MNDDPNPGVSPNPGGKPKIPIDVVSLAREYTPKAIHRLGAILDSKNERAAAMAASIILDRAWGRPVTPVATEQTPPLILLHLAAATAHGAELQAKLGVRSVAGSTEPQPNVIDLAALPLPTE